MTLTDLLNALEKTGFATAIREGSVYFPWLESIHVLAIVVVVGTVSIMDLRLMGLTSHSKGVRKLMHDVLPYTWGAFALAAVTGFLMFSSSAVSYAANLPFRLKFIAMVVAGLNMVLFHFVTHGHDHSWDELTTPPRRARMAGLFSLLCWVFIVGAGRWIGFVR